MANTAGGIIIYGLREYSQDDKKHLPEKIDPIDRAKISKEWLEQIISNIQPRINDLLIHPVPINTGPNDVVYVVEIPKGKTAHQATNNKYYRRYNFISLEMKDYEIRDVMARSQSPIIDVRFSIVQRNIEFMGRQFLTTLDLVIKACNIGQIYAQYVNCSIFLPPSLTADEIIFSHEKKQIDDKLYYVLSKSNRRSDKALVENSEGTSKVISNSWFEPILPSSDYSWYWKLPKGFDLSHLKDDEKIYWDVYADNSTQISGNISIKQIPVESHSDNVVIIFKIFYTKTKHRIMLTVLLFSTFLILSKYPILFTYPFSTFVKFIGWLLLPSMPSTF